MHILGGPIFQNSSAHFGKGIFSKGKECALRGSTFFPFRVDLSPKGAWCTNRKSQKLSPLFIIAENLSDVSSLLNEIMIDGSSTLLQSNVC